MRIGARARHIETNRSQTNRRPISARAVGECEIKHLERLGACISVGRKSGGFTDPARSRQPAVIIERNDINGSINILSHARITIVDNKAHGACGLRVCDRVNVSISHRAQQRLRGRGGGRGAEVDNKIIARR